MTALAGLIERLEMATGPDRELDAEVFVATSPSPFEHYPGDCVLAVLGGFRARVEYADLPKFTSSIDVALTLVPEGWFPGIVKKGDGWECYVHNGEPHFAGMSSSPNPKMIWITKRGAHAAIALTSACLRARQALSQQAAA